MPHSETVQRRIDAAPRPLEECVRRDPPRLRDHQPRRRHGAQQHLGHARRLAASGLARDERHSVRADAGQDLLLEGVHRQPRARRRLGCEITGRIVIRTAAHTAAARRAATPFVPALVTVPLGIRLVHASVSVTTALGTGRRSISGRVCRGPLRPRWPRPVPLRRARSGRAAVPRRPPRGSELGAERVAQGVERGAVEEAEGWLSRQRARPQKEIAQGLVSRRYLNVIPRKRRRQRRQTGRGLARRDRSQPARSRRGRHAPRQVVAPPAPALAAIPALTASAPASALASPPIWRHLRPGLADPCPLRPAARHRARHALSLDYPAQRLLLPRPQLHRS
eukprot:scaffold19053_cov99-Isochrysis_galbana.AAC.3